MVYNAKQYHGLGSLHPWYNQQLKHLQILIWELANSTPTGLFLQVSAEQLCLELGLPGNIQGCTLVSIQENSDIHMVDGSNVFLGRQ